MLRSSWFALAVALFAPMAQAIPCLDVLTPATNDETGACEVFTDSCIPWGWTETDTCDVADVPAEEAPNDESARCERKITEATDIISGRCVLLGSTCIPMGYVAGCLDR
jgi:hypothetical protein